MSYICPICALNPTSHSLKKIGEKDGVSYFYTCPAKASKYNDSDGILAHYRGVLNDLSGAKWVWIFDSEGFSAKHALDMSLPIKLAKLIDEYRNSLVKIEIINATWHIRMVLKVIYPFLSEETKMIVRINDELKTPKIG